MIKNTLGVIAGYVIFVITSLALFKISGQKPHAEATSIFMIGAVVYSSLSSFIAGLTTQLIAKTKNLKINYIVAFIIAGFATLSLVKSDGNHWTQICAIFIFAPVSILGGVFCIKKLLK